ncbi:MAG: YbaK/EbsC family protein [Anaerolineales bacterium]|nr:MAG: YbaK/EbsC family protein [Anaerolineales bacterium]
MHPSARKVADEAQQLGLNLEIVEFQQTTRTAQDAANAIGCQLAQFVKSLLFLVGGQPVMALMSGTNRLDERKLAALRGVGRKKVKRADADATRAATGFSIGGVPPFGHTSKLPVYVDADLTRFGVVWAAAGTPFAVFAIPPDELVRASGGMVADLAAHS